MATTYKTLGQNNPTATTATTLYTTPSSTSAVVSTIQVCNQAATAATFRIAVRPTADVLAAKHYLLYDTTIPANDGISLTLGISLAAGELLVVYASTGTMSFSAFGAEFT